LKIELLVRTYRLIINIMCVTRSDSFPYVF
jgi:hypothetical protein